MTIKITWRTSQKEESKFPACSVGPVRCGDLRQSNTSCSLPAPSTPSQGFTGTPWSSPQLEVQEVSVFTHSGSRKPCSGKQSCLENSPGKPGTMAPENVGVSCHPWTDKRKLQVLKNRFSLVKKLYFESVVVSGLFKWKMRIYHK